VILFAVEFGVGQHQPHGRLLGSRLDDCGQIRTIVPRATSCDLRQQELLIQIHDDHPLQPMSPRQRFLPVMMHAPLKECADRSLRQARRIDGHAGSPWSFSARAAQPRAPSRRRRGRWLLRPDAAGSDRESCNRARSPAPAPGAIRDACPAALQLRERSSPRGAPGKGSPATAAVCIGVC
jgi:hypothetical protein